LDSIQKDIYHYTSQGLRVLVLAHSDKELKEDNMPTDFSPISLILLVDNIRPEAYDTVKWFKENNVAIKVISGDNPITVAEVAKRVGIKNADKFISLEGLNDQEVFEVANKYTVFGRVSPEQKAILLKSIKCAGHVTAMTGDGVNDILAMKEADCAVTVASGSDAARNVSNLVLTDNNFNSMPQIVYEGRRVINNIQSSSSLFLMKTLFTMLFSLVILCIPSITYYPFKLEQMIVLEVFIIGLPSFFLSFQPNDSRVSGKFIEYVISKSLPSAILMVLSVFIMKGAITIFVPDISNDMTTTMEVFAIIFSGIINLVRICRPFNAYRTVLFSAIATIVASIVLFTFFFGLSIFNFQSFMPIKDNI
ncbi:MAG: HAD-IC family P-type ATPase, partial [Firmicutes bacterium]|nr:HAD-IC family P-type ATPase [Candidatus Caballimonas caccae]